jgi:hypothetical protein
MSDWPVYHLQPRVSVEQRILTFGFGGTNNGGNVWSLGDNGEMSLHVFGFGGTVCMKDLKDPTVLSMLLGSGDFETR